MTYRNPISMELVQANPTVGAIENQLAFIRERLDSASTDLLIFPECFLTGYPLQDLVLRPGFLHEVNRAIDQIAEWVIEKNKTSILIGAPMAGTQLPYNAAFLLTPEGRRQVALKTELPNNDVFDERRVFARGENPLPLDFQGWKLGVMICEDMWHGKVARALADEGADCLIVLNGSPMETGKQDVRVAHATRRCLSTGLPLVYLNLVGGQDELVFDGGSFALNCADGQVEKLFEVRFQEASIRLTLDSDGFKHAGSFALHSSPNVGGLLSTIDGIDTPGIPYSAPMEQYAAAVLGLRDYVRKNGFNQVLLGLSGGLDSALVAAIAADALGAENVWCAMMPSRWTGDESLSLAKQMADKIGCRYANLAVGEALNTMGTLLDQGVAAMQDGENAALTRQSRAYGVANENIQARVRGQLLMNLSNAIPGTLVLSTGNKSEMSVGYATLYGDMCGGFNPIKDLYKTEVRALALWRNRFHAWLDANPFEAYGWKGVAKPIPPAIITRPPTAELAPDQTDEKALGSYEHLDAVLRCLIEEGLPAAAAATRASRLLGEAIDVTYADKIAKLVRVAEYKRRQAPPGIKVSGKSFGFGWRYPITNQSKL